MTNLTDEQVFEVLGYKVRPNSNILSDGLTPEDISSIVNTVNKEAAELLASSSKLDNGQVSILLALKYAAEKMGIESEYKKNLNALQVTANKALGHLEELDSSSQ